jgi:hypothetical protein
MPTKRTMEQLYAFFETGQADGAITPDRIQDALFTMQGGWGRISLTSSALTNITAVDTWVKAAGTTALAAHSQQFTMPENNRLQCTCPIPSIMEISATVSIVDGNNRNFQIALARNGSLMTETITTVRLGPGGDTEEAFLIGDFSQELNDYVEVWVRNISDSTDVTITSLNMRARTYVV